MRRKLIAGNWKMHGSKASIELLLAGLQDAAANASVDVAVCPPAVYIDLALAKGQPIQVGGQDCSEHSDDGAFTGEISARMLKDAGCDLVLLGHSERRQYHGESDELIGSKLSAAVAAGLTPVLCVGETREQREAGDAEQIVAAQLQTALAEQADLSTLVVAYEPVWAIGTGLTATPEQAQAMHAFIRETLADISGVDAQAVPLLYGGSVKAGNAAELFAEQDIDGALVGGAALDAEQFAAIIAASENS
ncbi:MAG: triose-phosphate isomerase [Gammaproteobacteria bacterium]|nr:MAG: triose-phosphate isomerase [Gammaproteobacteria bacterium]